MTCRKCNDTGLIELMGSTLTCDCVQPTGPTARERLEQAGTKRAATVEQAHVEAAGSDLHFGPGQQSQPEPLSGLRRKELDREARSWPALKAALEALKPAPEGQP